MATFPDFQRGIARQRGSRADQFRRIKQSIAAVALIAPGLFESAVRACPENISVRKKPPIHRRPDLVQITLFDQAGDVELSAEVLRQRVVLPG